MSEEEEPFRLPPEDARWVQDRLAAVALQLRRSLHELQGAKAQLLSVAMRYDRVHEESGPHVFTCGEVAALAGQAARCCIDALEELRDLYTCGCIKDAPKTDIVN